MAGKSVTIIDSGICNLFNVKRAFHSLGADLLITRSKKDILGSQRVVLPGVGAFGAGMESLKSQDLVGTIRDYVKDGKPLLGICLGMQLIASFSEEHGRHEGLDLVRGKVRMFRKPEAGGSQFKIPQIGWNLLEKNGAAGRSWQGTLLEGLGDQSYVYFVHSFVVEPEDEKVCLARTSYGRDHFCSVLRKDNITACQFHPERSGAVGMKILNNFLRQT